MSIKWMAPSWPNWPFTKPAHPELLLLCPTYSAAFTLHTCCYAVKNTSQSNERKLTTPTEKVFWYITRSQLLNCVILKEIQTINIVLCLFNVSWQITLMPQFNHVNRSSFHIYLKHDLNMNKHQKVFHFNHRTPFFKCKSIKVNLLFWLICC